MARKPRRDLTIDEQLARGPLDLPFLMLVVLLTGVGLIMMFSASYASAYYYKSDPFYYAKRQAIFVFAGIPAMYMYRRACMDPYPSPALYNFYGLKDYGSGGRRHKI